MSRLVAAATPDEVRALALEWSRVPSLDAASLYVTPEWVCSLWESHFEPGAAEFLSLRREGSLEAVFPVARQRVRKHGLSFLQAGLVTNSYSQNHNELIAFGDVKQAAAALIDHLDGEGWDIFFMGSVQVDSATHTALRALAEEGLGRLVEEPYVASPYLPLGGDWKSFLRSRSSNFRSDMKRKWNKATAAEVEFAVVRDEAGVEGALGTILDIESRSWKEEAGSSISGQEAATRFYRVFLPRAARRGWLYLVLMTLNGRPAAYDMGILLGGKYYMLKTSFDQELAALSPGVVLRQWVVRELFRMEVAEHDFLGDSEPYKLRWTDAVRPHVNLFLYNRKSLKARAYAAARALKG